jgi:ABC-type bacteriocin/lantibiotic exporter with double-glycine peptidase domain
MYNIKPKNEYLKKAYTLNQINKSINMKMLNNNLGEIKENNHIQKIEDYHIGSKLKIKEIIKRYNNSETNALDSLSFNAYENEIFVLLGQNGAGKSTFISILSGLIEADSGSIIYGDESRNEEIEVVEREGNKKFRKILGVCPQNNNILFDDLTVKENL